MRLLTSIFIVFLIILPLPSVSADEELKDPRERDEDISGTEVLVDVTEREDGLFQYEYSIHSPESNKGIIRSFQMDIACELDFDEVEFPLSPGPGFGGDHSDGQNVPLVPRLGDAFSVSIGMSNRVSWLASLDPGESAQGVKIISPAPPGLREYRLVPFLDTQGWDYDSYQDVAPGEEEPVIPWIGDFMVVGSVTGPACSLESPEEPERFAGHPVGNEKINKLLTYSEPLRNRLRVDEDQPSVTVTIHFDERIDPETFRVQPAWARRHFDAPRPGGSQTVEVPLRGPRTQLQFEVHPRKSDQPRDEDPYHHSFKDMDVFEIRQGDMKAPPGRERDPQQGGNRND